MQKRITMVGIITGDIINSREAQPKKWLEALKEVLSKYGASPSQWEIYRGDSFQLEVPVEEALNAAILIKAAIKQYKHIDVRLAIGIGDKTYTAESITESNGSAFINSGECFDQMKKRTLAVKSPNESFDIQINVMIELALLTMNHWQPITSTIVKTSFENPDLSQKEMAGLLGKSQSNISEGLKRAGYDEILKMIHYYKTQIQTI